MVLKVCLAGATGWAGSELARGIAKTADIDLVAAVARKHAGRVLGEVVGEPLLTGHIYASAAEALATPCDVFVEYTKPDTAKTNVLSALEHGAHVVVGTSGLTDSDFAQIDVLARKQHRGVLACGNFALTVVLLQKFAESAARLIPQWEIIDYAHDDKVDAPSGTAHELAFRLSKVRNPEPTVPLTSTVGPREARGATVSGSQVHSIRLPGYVISAEIIFGMPDQKLTIRHDSGNSARPYVDGALLAIRKVSTLVGGSSWSGLCARSLRQDGTARLAAMTPNQECSSRRSQRCGSGCAGMQVQRGVRLVRFAQHRVLRQTQSCIGPAPFAARRLRRRVKNA